MKEISCKEVKEKLDRNEDFKLVFCMPEDRYRKTHIPGSILLNIYPDVVSKMSTFKKEIQEILDVDDEIVVYCTDVTCTASVFVYQILDRMNYTNFARFSGGLREWEEDGYELVGDNVQ